MPVRQRGLAVLVAVVALALLAPAAGAETQQVDLTYEVGNFSPGDGTVDVALVIGDTDGNVQEITFRTKVHEYPVTNVNATGGTLEEVASGWKLDLDRGPSVFRYTVGVERSGFGEGYRAHLAATWGVLKAEALGLGFRTLHYDSVELVWSGGLAFHLPDGWDVAGPWNRTGPSSYDLPHDEPLPRGFYAVGEDLDVTVREGPWKTYRYAQIGDSLAYASDALPYLEAATPYYESVYGNHTGWNVLAVSAPDPMHDGGLGGWNSIYVHEDSDLETWAHEYAHVWQRFRAVEDPDADGGSSLWIIEGDADYRGPLSLVATEFWSPDEAEDHFRDVEDRADREGWLTTPLDQATYGGTHERVAYAKGALTWHQLQRRMSAATDGQVGTAAVVRALNERHSPAADGFEDLAPDEQPVNNSEVRGLIEDLLSPATDADRSALLAALDGYVHEDDAPRFEGLEQGGHLSFSDLVIDPPTALEGTPSTVTARVTNTGPTEVERAVELRLDGQVVDTQGVQLASGEDVTVELQLPDLAPGTYDVRVAYLDARYRVLAPPALELRNVDLVPPEVPQGREVQVLVTVGNTGGASGDATVRVALGGVEAGTAQGAVPGGLEETFSVTIRPEDPGQRDVEVTLLQGDAEVDETARFLQVLRDRDGDGVPDADDAYPDHPGLQKQSTLNDARAAVPLGPAAALASLAVGAALAGRRR